MALKMGNAPADKNLALPGYAQSMKAEFAQSSKVEAPRSALASSAGGAGAERPFLAKEVLVLSDRAIAARNCLVVTLGFADLMLGLEASGGATLTVL